MTTRFFARWYTTRHREPQPRTACPACQGSGSINETGWCDYCDGRGYLEPDRKD